MAQASVLTDTEIRRVFRIIETTRHAERNRLAFTLSIYAGLRVGEISALTVGDVATAESRVRREIKLGAHQTKGSKGRTVVLSNRVRNEIEAYLKTRSGWRNDGPLRLRQRIRAILDPLAASRELSPLARNIVDLMCADRGVTGRILKPYFRDFLASILSPCLAALLTDHVSFLFLEFELGSRLAEGLSVQ
jgi:integrase